REWRWPKAEFRPRTRPWRSPLQRAGVAGSSRVSLVGRRRETMQHEDNALDTLGALAGGWWGGLLGLPQHSRQLVGQRLGLSRGHRDHIVTGRRCLAPFGRQLSVPLQRPLHLRDLPRQRRLREGGN